MKNSTEIVVFWLTAATIMTACATAQAQQANPYFTGDGGKGIRLAVLEPTGKGLSENDTWVLSLVQGSLSGDFNKYSGMTIIDRQNLEKILGEWEESMSENYSDEDRAKIGNLVNANHILTGNITKTATSFIIEFYVTDVQSGVRKASYSPKPVSLFALENLSAVKEASADLLTQLGVKLTTAGIEQLKQAENTSKIQAETMLARGITAQKRGTEVAALSYFFQAASLDPSLAEAANRSSVMAANVSSGNIGADVRNDIAWRKAWINRLEETERYIDNLNKTAFLPYTLFYSDEIIQGDINYQNETVSLTIKTNWHGGNSVKVWANSLERALKAVYDGLEATQRKNAWGLNGWPDLFSLTDLNLFTIQRKTFNIVAELVNAKNAVIGRQEFKEEYYWEYNKEFLRISAPLFRERKDVIFTNVKADDITDNLTIRFANVNGEDAETAAKKGWLQIKAMPKSEFNANDQYTFAFGEITQYKGTDKIIEIPDKIWDDTVKVIGEEAFSSNALTRVTIPNGVTYIRKQGFAWNYLTCITIGKNVTLGQNSFGNGFEKYYYNGNRKAGTYIRPSANTSDGWQWHKTMTATELEKARQRFKKIEQRQQGKILTANEKNARQRYKEAVKPQRPQKTAATSTSTTTTANHPAQKTTQTKWIIAAFMGGGPSLMMDSVDTIYKNTGGQFYMGLEWFRPKDLFHFGLDGIMGFVEIQDEKKILDEIQYSYPDIPLAYTGMSGHFFKLGVFAKMYPIDIMYLSGGVALGSTSVTRYVRRDGDTTGSSRQISEIGGAPVFSVGAGFTFLLSTDDRKVVGIMLDARYNMMLIDSKLKLQESNYVLDEQFNKVPPKNRLAKCIQINFATCIDLASLLR